MVKIVICDDSQDYCEVLKCKIEDCFKENFQIEYSIKTFHTLDGLKNYLECNTVDIVFLDIMLDDVNSVDWSLTNIEKNKTQFIFITSYPQSAYNISETNCCYFLIKTKMTDEMLKKALTRALRNLSEENGNLITIKQKNKHITLNYCDIVYIETMRNNIQIHLKNAEVVNLFSTLKKFSNALPPIFLHCHKSYVVNMKYVKECRPFEFIMNSDDEKVIPIPPKKYKNILESYEKFVANR